MIQPRSHRWLKASATSQVSVAKPGAEIQYNHRKDTTQKFQSCVKQQIPQAKVTGKQ